MALVEPVFDRLSDPELLERVERGDTQNPNESLHSLIWNRSPKHIFASPEAIRVSTALAVIHKNVRNLGLIRVLEALNITANDFTRQALQKIQQIKEQPVTVVIMHYLYLYGTNWN
jgi:hypothetical protein